MIKTSNSTLTHTGTSSYTLTDPAFTQKLNYASLLSVLPLHAKKDHQLYVDLHGGGPKYQYTIGDTQGNGITEFGPLVTYIGNKELYGNVQTLHNQPIDNVYSIACNHEGGGRPEFYEKLLDKNLNDVVMTPPGYYGIAGQQFTNGFGYLYNMMTGTQSVAPQHHYHKIRDSLFGVIPTSHWEDQGEVHTPFDQGVEHYGPLGLGAMAGLSAAGLAYHLYKKMKKPPIHPKKTKKASDATAAIHAGFKTIEAELPAERVKKIPAQTVFNTNFISAKAREALLKKALHTEQRQYTQTAQVSRKPSAVIVKGNPDYINGNPAANRFYKDLAQLIREKGYTVSFDAGKAYTMPPPADLWLGHSRGNDRFRFAPKEQQTISLGTPGGINHPLDDLAEVPNVFHYKLTKDMRQAILNKLDAK